MSKHTAGPIIMYRVNTLLTNRVSAPRAIEVISRTEKTVTFIDTRYGSGRQQRETIDASAHQWFESFEVGKEYALARMQANKRKAATELDRITAACEELKIATEGKP